MGEWIGDRAEEAVRSVYSRMKELEKEIELAHMVLDTYDVPRYEEIGEHGRPYSLRERIELNHEKNRADILHVLSQAGILSS